MKLAWAIAVLGVSAFAAERNGIANPGFESGMEGWDTAGGAAGIAIDAGVAHGGKQSVRLSGAKAGATAGVHQYLRFTEAFQHPVRVAGWSKAERVAGEAFLMWIEGEYADGTKIERESVDFETGTHDWQYREFTFDPLKPVKSLEFVAVLIQGTGTAWFDDLEVKLAPFAFRGITVVPDTGVVADLTAQATWKAELRNASGVVGSASGEGPPVQLHWAVAPGNYTLRLSATDALREETIEEVRQVRVRAAPNFSVWVESSMQRVLPQALPGKATEARIALAGNEYESFQICLLSGKPLKGVRIETGDLIAGGGRRIPASQIEWLQVGYVYIEHLRRNKATEGKWAGWWPDPLLPVEKFDLEPGFTQPVWITVHTVSGTPAGEYTGAIRVLAEGQPPITVPVHVKVYGFSLPAENHLKTAFAMLGEQLESIYGRPVSAQLRRRFGDFMLQHRLNADDIYRMTASDPDDTRHYRELGLNAYNLLYLIPANGYPVLSSYTPELRQTLLDRLAAPIPQLREAGLLKQAYVYGFDELDPEFFPVMRDYFGEIKRRYPEVHTMTTAHIPLDPKTLKDLHVDWIVPIAENYDFAKAEECRRAGLQVWSYVALPREGYATFLADDPLIQARVLMWQAWQQKMDGFLYWGMNIWDRRGNRRPLDLAGGPRLDWGVTTGKEKDERYLQELNGDGQLVYPVPDGPIGSIRLANLRDGLEDYEYLWMTGKRDAGLAVARDLTHFTLDPAAVYAQRDKIAKSLARRP